MKKKMKKPSICLVAEENNAIAGLIDVELDSDDLMCNQGERGVVIWHLGVLPEYRKKGVAKMLWNSAKEQLEDHDIRYCEVWTQEDLAANSFYQANGFKLEESQTWIRCYASGKKCWKLLNENEIGDIYGPEELIFDAPLERKEELKEICYRIDEVRLYSTRWTAAR